MTTFDLEGRPVEIRNAAGGTKVLEYDVAGNKTLETGWYDEATPRIDVEYEYDEVHRLTRRLEPLGRTTEYAYDPVDNVTGETLLDRTEGSVFPLPAHRTSSAP